MGAEGNPIDIPPRVDPCEFAKFQRLAAERAAEGKRSVPVLEARGVVKRYGDKTVIPGLSFTIEDVEGKAEIVSIVGTSGCGKTTVLRMIAGLEPATSGEILCSGRRVEGPDMDRGMIFQKYSSFPFLNVIDNIAYPLVAAKGVKWPDARGIAEHWVKKMYLDGAERKYPHQLSGGMQQRVAIARSLCMEAKILLMDEPFGALDRKIRWEMQDLVAEVAFLKPEREFTVFLVTHDIAEAVYLGDRIWVMNRGTIHRQEFAERPTEPARAAQSRPAFLDTVAFFNEEIDRLDLGGGKK